MGEGRRCLGCGSVLAPETSGGLCAACGRNANHETAADTKTIVSPSNPRVGSSNKPASNRWFLGFALALGSVVFAGYAFGTWVIVTQAETAKLFGWEAALRGHRWIVS